MELRLVHWFSLRPLRPLRLCVGCSECKPAADPRARRTRPRSLLSLRRGSRCRLQCATPMPTATCPFCGLLCDDLLVESDGHSLLPIRNTCERSRAAYGSLGTPSAARAFCKIQGLHASADDALDAAAKILRSSR